MNFDMEERIERLERLVEAQETQLDYLKKELEEMNDKYNKLEFKIRVNSAPLYYNPCR
jgi:uncharacterized coiled-coil protein SlyX